MATSSEPPSMDSLVSDVTEGTVKAILSSSQIKAYITKFLVGAEGFEPPTACSQSRCATRLRYAPTKTTVNNEQ